MRLNIFCGLAALGIAFAVPAGAATVLDQDALVAQAGIGTSQVAVGVRNLGGNQFTTRYVQTVTAGLNGSLAGIELQGFRNVNQAADTLRLTLIDGDYAAGARTSVGSRNLNAATLPVASGARSGTSLIQFDTLAFNYAVTAGQMFSVLVEVVPLNQAGTVSFITANVLGTEQLPNGSFRTITEGANYQRGGLYQLTAAGNPITVLHDIGFRSFVNVGAVPEPATWAMLILGFGVVGASLRRRREAVLAV